jgi:hypothetical protein
LHHTGDGIEGLAPATQEMFSVVSHFVYVIKKVWSTPMMSWSELSPPHTSSSSKSSHRRRHLRRYAIQRRRLLSLSTHVFLLLFVLCIGFVRLSVQDQHRDQIHHQHQQDVLIDGHLEGKQQGAISDAISIDSSSFTPKEQQAKYEWHAGLHKVDKEVAEEQEYIDDDGRIILMRKAQQVGDARTTASSKEAATSTKSYQVTSKDPRLQRERLETTPEFAHDGGQHQQQANDNADDDDDEESHGFLYNLTNILLNPHILLLNILRFIWDVIFGFLKLLLKTLFYTLFLVGAIWCAVKGWLWWQEWKELSEDETKTTNSSEPTSNPTTDSSSSSNQQLKSRTRSKTKSKTSATALISETLTTSLTTVAIRLKQSPIPDVVASCTKFLLNLYSYLDSSFDLEEYWVQLGQWWVRFGVVVGSVVGSAVLRAGVAYQMAPSYRDVAMEQQKLQQVQQQQQDQKSGVYADGKEKGLEGSEDGVGLDTKVGGERETVKVIRLEFDVYEKMISEQRMKEQLLNSEDSVKPDNGVDIFAQTEYSTFGAIKEIKKRQQQQRRSLRQTQSFPTLKTDTQVADSASNTNLNAASSSNNEPLRKTLVRKSSGLVSAVFSKGTNVASSVLKRSSAFLIGEEAVEKIEKIWTDPQPPASPKPSATPSIEAKQDQSSNIPNELLPTSCAPLLLPQNPTRSYHQQQQAPSAAIRNVNVGGTYFATTLKTFSTRYPDSKIAKWFIHIQHQQKQSLSNPSSPKRGGAPGPVNVNSISPLRDLKSPRSLGSLIPGERNDDFGATPTPTSSRRSRTRTTSGTSGTGTTGFGFGFGVLGGSEYQGEDAVVEEWSSVASVLPDGTLFIDRDGTHFQHILNHLRGKPLDLCCSTSPTESSTDDLDDHTLNASILYCPSTQKINNLAWEELRREAIFYELYGLVKELDDALVFLTGDADRVRQNGNRCRKEGLEGRL